MAITIPTPTNGAWVGGVTVRTTQHLDVSTGGGNALTTTPVVILGPQNDAGVNNRALSVKWTGDQTLGLLIQYDLGDSTGNALETVARINFSAGNVTPQEAIIYASINSGIANGTSLISGTQPTLATSPAVATLEFLRAPADRIQIQAVAGGTTTVGLLIVSLMEIP